MSLSKDDNKIDDGIMLRLGQIMKLLKEIEVMMPQEVQLLSAMASIFRACSDFSLEMGILRMNQLNEIKKQ